ncbi:MAG: MarR family transcriptional regulator [Deltaproteobacteria bacterium]|jgi:DNA-binding MarR family transcriptional regulator|nr:MarR family transcriptional regulator [Deltaproteobacteria bacterium]
MCEDRKPEISVEKAVSKNLKRAYNIMHVGTNRLFKNTNITVAQFNLMETILHSGDRSLSIQDLTEKTISLQPNITRMVAELKNAGLVTRRSGTDRRTVNVQLTAKGVETVEAIQKPLFEFHLLQYKNLTKEELELLNSLLGKLARP